MDFFEPWIVRRPRRKESPFFELPNTTWPKIVGLLHWLIPKLDCFNIFLTFGLSGRKELFPNNWVVPASFFGNFGFWFFFGGTILTPAFRFFFGGGQSSSSSEVPFPSSPPARAARTAGTYCDCRANGAAAAGIAFKDSKTWAGRLGKVEGQEKKLFD